jgi:TonB family protein
MVELELALDPDGHVANVRIVRSNDARFDAEALRAAKLWRFTPAQKDGVAIAVVVILVLEFRLAEVP